MHHFFAYMARMRFIDRWALMRNSYTENIQEHSHQVAILAHALAVLRNEYFGGQVDAGAVAVAALYHDASEILTGDMPTPIKYYNPDIRDAYKQVEAIACRKLTGMLPNSANHQTMGCRVLNGMLIMVYSWGMSAMVRCSFCMAFQSMKYPLALS